MLIFACSNYPYTFYFFISTLVPYLILEAVVAMDYSSFLFLVSIPAFFVGCLCNSYIFLRFYPPSCVPDFNFIIAAFSPIKLLLSSILIYLLFFGISDDSVNHPRLISNIQQYHMDRDTKNNRSLLAMAGEHSLLHNNSNPIFKTSANNKKDSNNFSLISPTKLPINSAANSNQIILFDAKQILKKLGLNRLRKMQALVRGFLVRRTVYPRQLKDYLIAKSLMDLIMSNVIYRESSSIVVECVTLGQYDQTMGGQERYIEEYLYNSVIRRVILKQFEPIARQAIYQTALYASRPNITFGFNLRDPLQLILYGKTNQIIGEYAKEVAEEVLRQEAVERRQQQIVNNLIDGMDVLKQLYMQIIDQSLTESIGEYVVDDMINKMIKEGTRVVAQTCYNEAVAAKQDQFLEQLIQRAQEWLLQQAVITALNVQLSQP